MPRLPRIDSLPQNHILHARRRFVIRISSRDSLHRIVDTKIITERHSSSPVENKQVKLLALDRNFAHTHTHTMLMVFHGLFRSSDERDGVVLLRWEKRKTTCHCRIHGKGDLASIPTNDWTTADSRFSSGARRKNGGGGGRRYGILVDC